MRIHIVAVAGTGMGSLAGLLKDLGHEVSGSDVAFDPPMGPALEQWGVRRKVGFDARNLSPPPDLVVIGNVCRSDNPEARAAIDGGLPYTHIAGALQRFVLETTRPLVVAGTHGKTTTTAIAAWLLDQAGLQPGFLIGGIPKNFTRSFRAPRHFKLPLTGDSRKFSAPPFVLEGDEYDTAFFEKTAKFLHYRAKVAILTSIEHDHIDIYPTEASYEEAFLRFVAGIPEDGLLIANAADPNVVRLTQQAARCEVAWYALQEDTLTVAPHWLAAKATSDATGTAFDLYVGGVAAGRFFLPLAGDHNLRNALAAIAAAAQGYGAKLGTLGPSLAQFAGVKRRQEVIGTPRSVTVYDDFAHHPTAVRETLRGLRRRHPNARLFGVLEPRSATACRSIHQEEYAACWDAADDILFAPLGRTNISLSERLDTEKLATALSARGKRAECFSDVDAIVRSLTERARGGDVIVLFSNGAFGGIHEKLLSALKA